METDTPILNYIQQVNIELLNTLELSLMCTKQFCDRNNIPFYDKKLVTLLAKVESLLDELEIQKIRKALRLSDGFSQRKPSDNNFTAPLGALYKGGIVTSER